VTLAPNGGDAEEEDGVDSGDPSDAELLAEIEELQEERSALYLQQVASPDYPDRLRNAVDLLLAEPVDFKPGDLVMWKQGLRNRYFPAEGAPAIVVGLAPGAVSEVRDPGSAQYREPLDIQLGILDADGDFIAFYYDRRRFILWTQGDTED